MNIKLAFQMVTNMGLRYSSYRVFHELDKRIGTLQKKHPVRPEVKQFITLEQWKTLKLPFLFEDRDSIADTKNPTEDLQLKAKKLLSGEVCFFSGEWKNLGLDYDWITNPQTHYQYDNSKHWSQINDFQASNGDIKYVWEKSRFSHLVTLMRYDFHFETDNSAFIFSEIQSWIAANPINQGPNWKCSQEISLRLFNWLQALFFYKDSEHLTEILFQEMMHVMYWKLHHVFHHISFSRIAVRNNHAITETLALALSNLLFPFIPETKKWSKQGKTYFEQEIEYQIYDDGAFIQHSMNYHRVLIQLLTFGFGITQHVPGFFSERVYKKAYLALNFLVQFVQKENGKVPNYGSNDGALFFPLSDAVFQDYRPSLNSLHLLLTGTHLFDQKEDFIENKNSTKLNFKPLIIKEGVISFAKSGYFLFRTASHFTFIRCGSYKDRPAQADNLHLDIWTAGENVLFDGGTFQYNTDVATANYFFGTKSHNTVTLNNQDQMLKGGRFIWYYWTKALFSKVTETEDSYIFEGTIKAFSHLDPSATHNRKVVLSKTKKEWQVYDTITQKTNFEAQQLWNILKNSPIEITATESNNPIIGSEKTAWQSTMYGKKEVQTGKLFAFKKFISTKIALH